MHKSAMQQIQQIPRVTLGSGPGGPGGIGAESKPHQCQQCLKSFSSNHQLVQHIRVHTGEKPYKCSYCDRRFKQLSHVQQHTRLHTGERPYKCHLPDCGRAFIQLSNLQQHLRNHDAQVERAKNRPFHCNICGKGFATESSLRTHTSKELQLHLGVLQQHAALIGGPNATSCPICHKLFLGSEALMEHMKHAHKDPGTSSNVAISPPHAGPFGDNMSSSCLQSSNDPYLAKRRSANHPCPVCGKHYVNEGSLRKHLACHPETSQLTNSLRMWPCSVCQAVFTHENGLLTHMEHMRMDPKHQFAAQYVLSRAAAERRERDSILAATLAVSASGAGGVGSDLLPMTDGGSNSMCPSPSANSECSSNGRLSSSGGSDQGSSIHMMGGGHGGSSNANSSKLNDILRSSNNSHLAVAAQYGAGVGVDADLHANRMSLMAASAAAAAAAVAASTSGSVTGVGMPSPGCVVDSTSPSGSAAVQAAVVNLAAAMRINQVSSSVAAVAAAATSAVAGGVVCNNNGNGQVLQQGQQQPGSGGGGNGGPASPVLAKLQNESTAAAMHAMRDSMMRSGMAVGGVEALGGAQQALNHNPHVHPQLTHHGQHGGATTNHHHHQMQQQHSPEAALRMQQQAEAILRSHTEAAFRLAASVAASNGGGAASEMGGKNAFGQHQQHQHLQQHQHHQHHQQQAHGAGADSIEGHQQHGGRGGGSGSEDQQQTQLGHQQESQQQQQLNVPPTGQQQQHLLSPQQQANPDLGEALRLQEHRLEQALRLHNDVRALNFLTAAAAGAGGGSATGVGPGTQQQQTHHTP